MAKILELNLIKTDIKMIGARRHFSRYSRIMFALAFLAFAGVSYDFYAVNQKISKVKKELAKLEGSIAEKRNNYNMEDREKEWGAYCGKLRVVDALVKARSDVGARLKICANKLPPKMCVGRVEGSLDKGVDNFVIEIMTKPSEHKGFGDIENFISGLESSMLIGKGVKLESHERRIISKDDIEVFKISFPTSTGEKK